MCKRRKVEKEAETDPWKVRESSSTARRPITTQGDLGTRLRADILPASQASARFKAYRPRITSGRLLTFFLVVALVGVGWFFGIGPGRPGLEKGLTNLIRVVRLATMPTPTATLTATAVPSTATVTPIPTATWQPVPSWTPTSPVASATSVPSETPTSACRDFSTITLDDVGNEWCVQGTVIQVIRNPGNTLIIFSVERDTMYWVTYDVIWPEGTEGMCYQMSGEIEELLNNPVLVFGYNNLPTECP